MPENDPKPSLESVEARLAAVREERAEKAAKEAGQAVSRAGMSLGMRIGIELLAAVLVGVGIGLLLDNYLETTPIFTLAFVALGFAAGVMNVIRLSKGLDQRIGLGAAIREKEAADAAAGKTPANAPPKARDDDDD